MQSDIAKLAKHEIDNKTMPVKKKTVRRGQKRSKPTPKIEPPQTAEEKRLHSIALKKQEYKNNVSVVQAALANVDTKNKTKIVFDEDGDAPEHIEQLNNVTKKSTALSTKKSLFDDEDDDENEAEPNFEVKEQFQGKKGKKLMELQSKFKNDKRFALDERFLEEDKEESDSEKMEINEENIDNEDITKEKEQEFAILEQVLGKKIIKASDRKKSDKRTMLRYDPSQANHSIFEVKEADVIEDEEFKAKKSEEQPMQEDPKPEVSKETFYQVTDGLKDALQAGQSYSLLNMFGRPKETEKLDAMEERPVEIKKSTGKDFNPFHYDSSGESEVDDRGEKNEVPAEEELPEDEPKVDTDRANLWTETLFFKKDDYRLQEGVNFLRRFEEAEEPQIFSKVRRDIMEIVRAKVRHNKRKLEPFQKKLGGRKKLKRGKGKIR